MVASKRMRTAAIICAAVLGFMGLIEFFVYPVKELDDKTTCIIKMGVLSSVIKELHGDNGCIIRMRILYRVACSPYNINRRTAYLYPDLDYHRGGEEYAREIGLCPACHKPYVYHPFAGPIDIKGDRIIAWCPEPCHWGKRRVLLETGGWELVSESDFQKIVASGEMKLSSANLKPDTDTFRPMPP